MPLSGGTSGVHDDSMHQGSAKRDIAGGVGGLDASGFLLAKGAGIAFPRTGSDDVHIYERTSGEEAYAFHRVGADDYTFYIKESNVWKRFQTESMKDVVNGIAALDVGGNLIAPGLGIYITRSGTGNIVLGERTSGETMQYWHRVGVDDYVSYVKVGGGDEIVQHAGLKDVANGIAGLDANVLLSPALLPPCMEEYSNHLGAVDNFTQTGTTGTGSANSDAANHEMDLSTGGGVGRAWFETKAVRVVGSKPTMTNMLIQNIQDGAGGARLSFIGCSASFSAAGDYNSMGFRYTDSGVWQTFSADASAEEYNAITALANGDLVSILATSVAIRFFVNGTLVQTHTTRIPAVGVKLGGYVRKTVSAGTVDRSLSIDMMSLRRYL